MIGDGKCKCDVCKEMVSCAFMIGTNSEVENNSSSTLVCSDCIDDYVHCIDDYVHGVYTPLWISPTVEIAKGLGSKERESTITPEDVDRLLEQAKPGAEELKKTLDKVFRSPNSDLKLR